MELLDAWRQLAWSTDGHRLAVAGTSAPDPDWQPPNRDTPGVDWLGFQLDVTTLLAATDVLAIPSTWPDPAPLSAIEAMASGTVIVASAVGGLTELVPPEIPELLVPPGDVAVLADRLRQLRDVPEEERSRLRKVLRSHAETHHDIDQVVERVESHLSDAAGSRPR